MTAPTIEPTTHTLEVPTASLAYDVRRNDASAEPVLLLIGSPMGAAGFATLAGHLADRTIVTYDPRGSERSRRTDGGLRNSVEEQADDLHRLIDALGVGPVAIFASSGGAVNALALVERHPEQVRTLVAHEPPLATLLPERESALAACRDIHETYLRAGQGPGMAKFIALVTHRGPIPADWTERPAPDPAMFGLPAEDDGERDDVLLAQNIIATTHFEPDLEALRRASTRIVPANGVESEGEMANRGAVALAERLGVRVVSFPSGHGGFLGGEYGQTASRRRSRRGCVRCSAPDAPSGRGRVPRCPHDLGARRRDSPPRPAGCRADIGSNIRSPVSSLTCYTPARRPMGRRHTRQHDTPLLGFRRDAIAGAARVGVCS